MTPAGGRLLRRAVALLAMTALPRLKPLDDGDIGEPAALAHGLQAPALAALLQRMDQRGHQPGARRAERMAERDGAAMEVEPRRIGLGLLEPRHRHRGESLV